MLNIKVITTRGKTHPESSRKEWEEIWDKLVDGEFDEILDEKLVEWLKECITN